MSAKPGSEEESLEVMAQIIEWRAKMRRAHPDLWARHEKALEAFMFTLAKHAPCDEWFGELHWFWEELTKP